MSVDTNIALTTLAKVKNRLGLTVSTYDDFLEDQINSISQSFADHCNRNFRQQTYTDEKYKGDDELEICLNNYPVTDPISALSIDDVDIDVSDIDVDTKAGILYYEELFTSKNYLTGISKHQAMRTKNILVTYEAGYVLPDQLSPTLPSNLENACINEVRQAYENQKPGKSIRKLKSWGLDKARKEYVSEEKNIDLETGWLLSTRTLLDKSYKRWVI